MELTGMGVVVILVMLFVPGLTKVLHSLAFRIQAAGKADIVRAHAESGRATADERRTGNQKRYG
ncbi:hypothetical protein ACH5AO_36955 [Streptomyces sp. NPDC018964]|uniref:hypothetical protein n=1 Tax=Streptomyces sp. NPDC018964 TaxID=3365058 RepID=UPI0037A0019B